MEALITALAPIALEFIKGYQAQNNGALPTSAELEAHLQEALAALIVKIDAEEASKKG